MDLETALPWAEGAGGRILRSRDAASGRDVAIKLVRVDSPEAAARIRREAAAQSRLDHPHVCPVLEVGEYGGQPAIVMPFIDGEPLDRAAAGLPLRGRVELLLQVVEAVAAAHRAGVVHRDLKPANLLVERRGEGRLHAWVLDFGIARAVDDATLTSDGSAIGTPGYMSPEQVRGEHDPDPRSDVYALGVLLFQLAAGRLPLPADTPAQMMLATATRDAPRLDRVAPAVPKPLAAIAARCLERDARFRYGDAAALALELRAWLDGATVRSRALGPRRRVSRFVRRNPGIAAVAGGAMLVLVAVGAVTITQSIAAARRAALAEELAREYGQLGERFESRIQLLQARPTQDVSTHREALERWLAARAADVEQGGDPVLERARDYALGRAALALGRPHEALRRLEAARAAGVRDDTLALRLAQAHLAVMARDADESRKLADIDARRARLAELEARHLPAAREALRGARLDDPAQQRLAEAIGTYLDGALDPALEALRDAGETAAWPVPALMLAADLAFKAALDADAASDQARALALTEAAQDDFERVATIARSHARALLGLCATSELLLALGWSGDLTASSVPRDLASPDFGRCRAAAAVDPGDIELLDQAGGALSWASGMLINRGGDPMPHLATVRELGERALALDPEAVVGHRLLGLAEINEASHRLFALGESPDFAEAVAHLERARELSPADVSVLVPLARARGQMAAAAYRAGRSGDEHYADAVEALARAAEQPESGWKVAKDRLAMLTERGYYLYTTGQPADVVLGEAASLAEALLARHPDNTNIQSSAAYLFWTLGEYQYRSGADPRESLARAEALYRQVIVRRPSARFNVFNMLGVLQTGAVYLVERGEDPSPALPDLREWLERLRGMMPLEERAEREAVNAFVEAMALAARGDSPMRWFREARGLLDVIPPIDRVPGLLLHARLARQELAWRCRQGRVDEGLVRADVAALAEGLAEHPDATDIRAERSLLLQQAASCWDGAPADWAEEGRRELAAALTADAALARRHAPGQGAGG